MDASLARVAQLAQVPLPRKPRLAPWITVVDLGDDRLQLRAPDYFLNVQHRSFIDAFHALRPLLDGTRTVDEIVASGAGRLPREALEIFLKLLRSQGALQEAAIAATDGNPAAARAALFLTRYADVGAVSVQSLINAKFAIIGAEAIARPLAECLRGVGATHVRALGQPTLADLSSPAWLAGTRAAFADSELVLAASEGAGYALFDAINAIALETGTRWMRLSVEGTRAWMGPTVVPRLTACYACYAARVACHESDPAAHAAYRRESAGSGGGDPGSFAPLCAIVAGQAAMEAVRLVTSYAPPVTFNRCHEQSASGMDTAAHTVLKVPRCPACGHRIVPQDPWDRSNLANLANSAKSATPANSGSGQGGDR